MMRGPAGMGGGSMIRAVGRAVGAGVGSVQEAISTAGGAARPAKPARVVSVASSVPTSPSSASSCAAASTERAGWQHPHPCVCDGEGWEPVGWEEAEEAAEYGFGERFVFGPVPSTDEVAEAVSTIQQIFVPVSFSQDIRGQSSSTVDKDASDKSVITDSMTRVPSSESESDWIEPAFQLCSSNNFQSRAREKVIDAFHLLQIDPSVKRTVISLSSDKAVWDAVMKNEAVQELRKSFCTDENGRSPSSYEDHNVSARLLRIFQSTKTRIMEFVEKITKIVTELFSFPGKDRKADHFEDALRSSFMLSVVVFIIVIITRTHKAP